MGLFDKFKKKKEINNENIVEKANEIEKPESIAENENNAESNEPNFLEMNAETHIGKTTSVYEMWSIYQSESETDRDYKPLEYIEPEIEKVKNQAENDKDNWVQSELIKFAREIQKQCDQTMSKIKSEKAAMEKEPEKKLAVSPVNAEPMLFMTKNKLRLWMVIIPPVYGGDEITSEAIQFRLDSLGIKYGMDSGMVKKAVSEKMYMKIVQIAVGKEPIHGKNGTCKNVFSKVNNHVNIKEDAHGNVNYKELNMIQSVHKGDVICEITLPTESADGMTVTGETVVGREGKYPAVPAGKNTEFNEDKTLLTAKIDGEVVFEDNKFHVRNLLTINSDVDNAVGNIDFTGDILIKGDVREGYTVKAEGDVRIIGTVEGATVIVGGDLQIDRGMTGGNKGRIEVQGKLKCKYLENCRVYAKEGIEADQIIYCNLSTDKDVVLKGKKGSVTGGRLIAGGKVEAESIGTLSNTTIKTEVVLGVIPHLVETEKQLKQELEESQNNLMKMSQDITYLNTNTQKLNDERRELLKNLLFQYQVDQMKNKKLEAELAEISEKIQANTENCGLKCKNVYPIMNLNVCGITQSINKEIIECRIVRKNNKTYVSGANLESMIVF